MSSPTPVEVSGLVRKFGYFYALDRVDLSVQEGTIALLLGSNGAGKTTLLRILAGLLEANEGTLRVLGLETKKDGETIRRRIGFLSHSLGLYSELTAHENLDFFSRLYSLPNRSRRIDDLLEEMNLSEWRDDPVRNYSRGMRQRLALARVFLHDPDLLLLDEPFTGLDARSSHVLAGKLRASCAAGKTVLLASHRLDVAGPVGDLAILLAAGRVAGTLDLEGTPSGERPRRLESFIEGAAE